MTALQNQFTEVVENTHLQKAIYGGGRFKTTTSKNHYYRFTFHCVHFHCRSNRSDSVILASSVGTIARPQPAVQTSTTEGLTIVRQWY